MGPDDLRELLSARLGDHVASAEVSNGNLTMTLDRDGYVEAAELCRDHPRLEFDFFDCLFGVDERTDGFSLITILWSTKQRHRVILRHLCAGGREQPVGPSLTPLYRGADWHEREAWDMFGIEFDGHPGLAPRILCPENFEGWPLRKDFMLATREAKPWPGAKEPEEQHAAAPEAPAAAEVKGPNVAVTPTQTDGEPRPDETETHTAHPEVEPDSSDTPGLEGQADATEAGEAVAEITEEQRGAAGSDLTGGTAPEADEESS